MKGPYASKYTADKGLYDNGGHTYVFPYVGMPPVKDNRLLFGCLFGNVTLTPAVICSVNHIMQAVQSRGE